MGNGNDRTRKMVRAAVLLAIAAVVQWLRLLLPLPPVASMLLIGSVVNLCLCLSLWTGSLKFTAVSCLLLPVFAWLQGHLFFWPLIPVIFLGNFVYCLSLKMAAGWKVALPPVLKAVVLWSGTGLTAGLFHLPAQMKQVLMVYMAVPQWATAAIGLVLAFFVRRALQQRGLLFDKGGPSW